MKIELKNVKYSAFASEETACFHAVVWVGNEKAGTARNDGRGGCTIIEPHTLARQLDAYGATLPEKDLGDIDGQPYSMKQTGESLIDDLLAKWLASRDLRSKMRCAILYTKAAVPGSLFEVTWSGASGQVKRKKVLEIVSKPDQLEALKQTYGMDKVLNTMAFDDALAIYSPEV